MTNKQREEVRKTSKNAGATISAYDPNREKLNGTNIIHIDNNRTQVGNKMCHGEKSAKDAINALR